MWGDSKGAEPARRGRQHLVELERSEQLYLVTGDKTLKIGALLCCATKKDPPWIIHPTRVFFLYASYYIQFLPLW